MVSTLVAIFHVYGFTQSLGSLILYEKYVSPYRPERFGGPWRFLTYINMNFQLVVFTLCMLTDMAYLFKAKSLGLKLLKIRDFWFSTIGLPFCILVFTTFWGIFYVDRELVYPAALDEIIPVWMNHVMHSFILITVLELLFTKHWYPTRWVGMCVSSATSLAYLAWILHIHAVTGDWVYPILEELQGGAFLLFIFVLFLLQSALYVIGEVLNRATGEYEEKEKSKKKK
uniref:Uncharacterized protein n=1 Tax=Ciona savignyi TaxID=51511 RepID=H2ZJX3_CIOSA